MKLKKVLAVFLLVANAIFQTTFADPAPPADALKEVDALFRELGTAAANRRGEIIESLDNLRKTQVPTPNSKATPESPVLSAYGEDPRNRAVLAEAIPALIDALDGTVKNKAWWILISIQGACPEPKKEVWQEWWKTTGQKRFTGEALKK